DDNDEDYNANDDDDDDDDDDDEDYDCNNDKPKSKKEVKKTIKTNTKIKTMIKMAEESKTDKKTQDNMKHNCLLCHQQYEYEITVPCCSNISYCKRCLLRAIKEEEWCPHCLTLTERDDVVIVYPFDPHKNEREKKKRFQNKQKKVLCECSIGGGRESSSDSSDSSDSSNSRPNCTSSKNRNDPSLSRFDMSSLDPTSLVDDHKHASLLQSIPRILDLVRCPDILLKTEVLIVQIVGNPDVKISDIFGSWTSFMLHLQKNTLDLCEVPPCGMQALNNIFKSVIKYTRIKQTTKIVTYEVTVFVKMLKSVQRYSHIGFKNIVMHGRPSPLQEFCKKAITFQSQNKKRAKLAYPGKNLGKILNLACRYSTSEEEGLLQIRADRLNISLPLQFSEEKGGGKYIY
ncbi:hypothetical protein RFI_17454, partial [Reticulomyxa filosa]